MQQNLLEELLEKLFLIIFKFFPLSSETYCL